MRYLAVEMPERFDVQFQSPNGEWMSEALSGADRFQRLDDGSYINSDGASGLWIRCVEHHPDYFGHVDGGGDRFECRLVPLAVSRAVS
jgi:hypothetical protein